MLEDLRIHDLRKVKQYSTKTDVFKRTVYVDKRKADQAYISTSMYPRVFKNTRNHTSSTRKNLPLAPSNHSSDKQGNLPTTLVIHLGLCGLGCKVPAVIALLVSLVLDGDLGEMANDVFWKAELVDLGGMVT